MFIIGTVLNLGFAFLLYKYIRFEYDLHKKKQAKKPIDAGAYVEGICTTCGGNCGQC